MREANAKLMCPLAGFRDTGGLPAFVREASPFRPVKYSISSRRVWFAEDTLTRTALRKSGIRLVVASPLLRSTDRKHTARAGECHGIVCGSGLWRCAEKLREGDSVRSDAIEVVGLAAEFEIGTPQKCLGQAVK